MLVRRLREVLGLFDELVQEPALPQDKLALYKSQVCAAITLELFLLWTAKLLRAVITV